MKEFVMSEKTFTEKTVAIVRFGPETQVSGMRPAEYFQVTIDPQMTSPSGEYIRFGKYNGDEIMGWQRVDAMTVIETLGEWDGDKQPVMTIGCNNVTMKTME